MTVLLLCATILLAGGIATVAYTLGRHDERARAERRRPHPAIATLVDMRGPLLRRPPLSTYEAAQIVVGLRGPLPAPSRPDPSVTERWLA